MPQESFEVSPVLVTPYNLLPLFFLNPHSTIPLPSPVAPSLSLSFLPPHFLPKEAISRTSLFTLLH